MVSKTLSAGDQKEGAPMSEEYHVCKANVVRGLTTDEVGQALPVRAIVIQSLEPFVRIPAEECPACGCVRRVFTDGTRTRFRPVVCQTVVVH